MTPREKILAIKDASPVILPSLLLCDFGDLRGELDLLEKAGVQALHLDVMDGAFVPNMTYGMPIVEGLARHTDLPLDVHLMIQEPSRYVEQFAAAGSDLITVHVEACSDLRGTLQQIRDLGVATGVALNPDTSLECILPDLDLCDLVLCMSVNAGFGEDRHIHKRHYHGPLLPDVSQPSQRAQAGLSHCKCVGLAGSSPGWYQQS